MQTALLTFEILCRYLRSATYVGNFGVFTINGAVLFNLWSHDVMHHKIRYTFLSTTNRSNLFDIHVLFTKYLILTDVEIIYSRKMFKLAKLTNIYRY